MVIPPVVVLPGYNRMLHNLRSWFGADMKIVDYRAGDHVPADTDVLRVPYDFRRSVQEAAEVVDRAVSEAQGAARGVVVVAHSLGGLVARYWIGPLRGWRHCHVLITLGTPHRGAPRALDWLVNGAGFGRLRHPSATRMLRGWPSVYEPLPQYPAGWTESGPIEPVELPASCMRSFMNLLTSLLGDELPKRGSPVPDRPWVGFDLDDRPARCRDPAGCGPAGWRRRSGVVGHSHDHPYRSLQRAGFADRADGHSWWAVGDPAVAAAARAVRGQRGGQGHMPRVRLGTAGRGRAGRGTSA
ncbi:MAG: esterase/lipase family protein [Pseudonocardiaceae bacterium]